MRKTQSAIALSALFALGVSAETMKLPSFGEVTVVDKIDCSATDHRFQEYPAGGSRVETILGKSCRVMPVQSSTSSFMSWRLGEGKNVKPNGAYVVVIEYPDDVARDWIVRNNANNSRRSFYTGSAIGDAWDAKYVDHHPESLKLPQTGKYQLWTALTFPGQYGSTVAEDGTTDIATEGFEFILAQYSKANHPESNGIAATRIVLCEIPDEEKLWPKINFPPAELPRRHIFWREEMSDGGAFDKLCASNGGLDWIEQKFRAMKMFGQNTYTKDMLEFGHNQHWDVDWKWRSGWEPGPGQSAEKKPAGRWMWGSNGNAADVWTRAVPLAVDKYGFDVLPYYEYGGAAGDVNVGALGPQKRAEPLDVSNKPDSAARGANYTHIWWSEGKLRVDITDPDTLAEFKYILEGTILKFRPQVEKGGFVGAWIRPRPGEMAIGFSDATRARFAKEANNGQSVSRADLKNNRDLYNRYIDWWGAKRAEFLDNVRKFLEEGGVKNAYVLLDNDESEGGPGLKGRGGLVTDDPETWKSLVKPDRVVDINDPSLVSQHLYLEAMKTPSGTWGPWEWQHACPGDDPHHYTSLKNVWLTMAFHRLFTVNDPVAFDAYRNGNGTDSIIRHYGLNENMVEKDGGGRLIGYAIADFERAGRACMMAEVNAVAHGDPVNIGYLMGSNFTRGFPGPVREFNCNFLALPALPSKVVEGASNDKDVVLRVIDAGKYGKYFALVYTGWTEKKNVSVRFPGVKNLVAAANGKAIPLEKNGVAKFNFQPWQLIAIRAK